MWGRAENPLVTRNLRGESSDVRQRRNGGEIGEKFRVSKQKFGAGGGR